MDNNSESSSTSDTPPKSRVELMQRRKFIRRSSSCVKTQRIEAGIASKPTIVMYLSCESLPNLRTLPTRKNDTFVKVSTSDGDSTSWNLAGETEIVPQNLNPEYSSSINVQYDFTKQQKLRFEVYDLKNANNKNNTKLVGRVTILITQILGVPGTNGFKFTLTNPASKRSSNGFINIAAEEAIQAANTVNFLKINPSASNVDKKDVGPFAKSDPYFVMYSENDTGNSVAVYRSETIKKTLNPQWKPFWVSLESICNRDLARSATIKVWDWDLTSEDDFIGETESFSISKLASTHLELPLREPKLAQTVSGYQNSGIFKTWVEPRETITFLDFISGGAEIQLSIAVDFGIQTLGYHLDPKLTDNHFLDAIEALGSVLLNYDHDRIVPLIGFGLDPICHKLVSKKAKQYILDSTELPEHIKKPNQVNKIDNFASESNCAVLNPNCSEMDSVLLSYQGARSQHKPAQKSYLAPVINSIASDVADFDIQQYRKGYIKYNVLLILSGGQIDDFQATVDAIVAGSQLPLSIIICGIGKGPFKQCEILDADDSPLVSSTGKPMAYDICQFVEFNKHTNMDTIRSETLQELPHQLLHWMLSFSILPGTIHE